MLNLLLGAVLWLAAGDGPVQRWFIPFVQGWPPAESKTGVGWTGGSCEDLRALGVVWYQDWTPAPADCGPDMRALAMVWNYHGGALPDISPYAWGVQLANEPNLSEQANMTVAETAELSWRAAHKWPGAPKIGPATFNDAHYVYQVYEYHERVYGVPPDWDYLAAHCYYPTAAQCIRHTEDLLRLGDNYDPPLKVFVTEWAILPCPVTTTGVAGAGDPVRAQVEAAKLRVWFDEHPRVMAHLWFASEIQGNEWWAFKPHPACDTALMRGGTLTEWGRWFRGAN